MSKGFSIYKNILYVIVDIIKCARVQFYDILQHLVLV